MYSTVQKRTLNVQYMSICVTTTHKLSKWQDSNSINLRGFIQRFNLIHNISCLSMTLK